jgi:hypothetical protein
VYIFTEAFSDLGLKKFWTVEFQITIFVAIMACWFRMFLHYFGEFLMVLTLLIPVTQFEPNWHTVFIEYAPWYVWQQVFVVLCGTLINTLIFSLMMLTSYLSEKLLKRFPAILSKIIAWFGIMTLLDPILVGIVDLCMWDLENGDMFKLYNYYNDRDGSGTVGIILQILIFFIVTSLNGMLFYFYLVFVHMNGRVIDLYYRLSGDIDAFFIPKDEEVSLNYLKWVCHKAIKKN